MTVPFMVVTLLAMHSMFQAWQFKRAVEQLGVRLSSSLSEQRDTWIAVLTNLTDNHFEEVAHVVDQHVGSEEPAKQGEA